MQLFVGNLPNYVTALDVARLFAGFKHGGFRVEQKRLRSGDAVFFATGRLESERAARNAIRKLDGKLLQGMPLVVREYVERSAVNERRALWRPTPWPGPDRRSGERRMSERRIESDEQLEAVPVALFRNGTLF